MGITITTLVVIMLLMQMDSPKNNIKNKGLILASTFFIISLYLTFSFAREIEIYGRVIELIDPQLIFLNSIGLFFTLNLPTVVLLGIYFNDYHKDKKKLKKNKKER